MPDIAHRAPILWRSGRAGESHRQRAYARSRRRAGQSRAVARAEQPDDGGRLFCRHQSRRRRGRDHAAAAGEGNRIPADQGRNPAGAVRHSAGRRNGEGAFARARARAYRLLGLRRRRQPRSDDEKGRLRALRGVRHGERRCLPDCLYVGYHRRTQGHDAFSPRHARHLRHVRKIRAARQPRRSIHRLAADRIHLRAWRSRAISAAGRRSHDPAGTRLAGRSASRRRRCIA